MPLPPSVGVKSARSDLANPRRAIGAKLVGAFLQYPPADAAPVTAVMIHDPVPPHLQIAFTEVARFGPSGTD